MNVTRPAASAPKAITAGAKPAAAPADTPLRPDDPAWHPGLLPEVKAARAAKGRIAEFTAGTLPPDVIKLGAPSYFRTYDQLKGAMFDLARQYPDLVEVKDIGDSYEKSTGKADRDIFALTITNKKASGPKPISENIAGMHAREIANPEMLMTFAKQLVEGYGRDPEATALLNTRQIDLIPISNPDGHAVVERGYARQPGGNLMKRKNTSGPGEQGTDQNRNFDFHWGGAGASASPSSETYRGPSAASELEVQAIQNFTGARKPSTFVDWHSYSKLNMYPWGDTRDKAPDYEGLKAVADKMSTMNHYSPMQSIDLYPTTGTTDDWAYGKFGIPAWAVETGDSFHQSDKEFANTLRENLPVLQYLAKIADKPYERVKGPDTTDVLIDAAGRTVSARVNDQLNGKDPIAGAELVLDPNAAPGSGIKLGAADGKFDSALETVTGKLEGEGAARFADGQLAYVRAQDAKGNWGPLTAQWLVGPSGDAARGARRT